MKKAHLILLIAWIVFTLPACGSGRDSPEKALAPGTPAATEAVEAGIPTAAPGVEEQDTQAQAGTSGTGQGETGGAAGRPEPASPTAPSEILALEMPLNPQGYIIDLNADDQGLVWVSDQDGGEIWGYYPEEDHYEIYHVGGAPTDARHEGSSLWWADGETGLLGVISTQDGAYTHWQVPGATGFSATALDRQGGLWALESSQATLHHLDPARNELCSYTLPEEALSSYLAADAQATWLGDYANGRILRLDLSDDSLNWWPLPGGSAPLGMALDGDGSLWYADTDLGALVQLDPDNGQLSSYALPFGKVPAMIALQDGWVWYSEHWTGAVGVLDPAQATPTTDRVRMEQMSLQPECTAIQPAATGVLTIRVGFPEWTPSTYPNLGNSGGWWAYDLPARALPWGMAITDSAWLVDINRHTLARFPILDPIQP